MEALDFADSAHQAFFCVDGASSAFHPWRQPRFAPFACATGAKCDEIGVHLIWAGILHWHRGVRR